MSKEEKEKLKAYTLKQGVSTKGSWKKDGASIVREVSKCYPSFVKSHNKNFKISGSYYELNESEDKKLQDAYKKGSKK